MAITRREAAIISAYTGIMLGEFCDMHEYAEEVMGGAIFTHQFADKGVVAALKEKTKADFLALEVEK